MKLFIGLVALAFGLIVLGGLAEPAPAAPSGVPRATNTNTPTSAPMPTGRSVWPDEAYPPPETGAARTDKAGPGEPCGFVGEPPAPWWVIRFGSDPPEYLPCPQDRTPTPAPQPTATLVPLPPRVIFTDIYNGSN